MEFQIKTLKGNDDQINNKLLELNLKDIHCEILATSVFTNANYTETITLVLKLTKLTIDKRGGLGE